MILKLSSDRLLIQYTNQLYIYVGPNGGKLWATPFIPRGITL